ncbi:hypothetical protein JMS36_001783 [Salmonella enterica]|nr:hypothetical protein [Salmonella enterica]
MSMTTEGTERLRCVYRFQQSRTMAIIRMVEDLDGIRGRLEDDCMALEKLAVQLQEGTNRSRLVMRRVEKKRSQHEGKEPDDGDIHFLSAARKGSLLRSFYDLHDTASLAADTLYRFAGQLRYAGDLLGLTSFTIKHFLWRERLTMALIHGNADESGAGGTGIDRGTVCLSDPWYEGKGMKRYSHLSAWRESGELHSRFYDELTRIAERGVRNMSVSELTEALVYLEGLGERLTGATGEVQRHVELLMDAVPE